MRISRPTPLGVALTLAGSLFLPATGRGQETPVSMSARTYGTKDLTLVRISAADFSGIDSAGYGNDSAGAGIRRFSAFPGGVFVASVHVPNGASVVYFGLDYCDTNAAVGKDVLATLELDTNHGAFSAFLSSLNSSFGNAGCDSVTSFLASPHTYKTDSEDIIARVQTGAGDETNTFSGVVVGYKLQMSPAPGSATFADVPTDYPYFQAIEALAAAGITSGCGGGNFCPGENVTRGELAKFLAKALGLHWPN